MKRKYVENWTVTQKDDHRAYARLRAPGDPATLGEYLAKVPKDYIEHAALRACVSAMEMPQTFGHFARMKWGSLIFPDLVPALMTSDRPVIRSNNLWSEDSHIVVPIGPKRIFYATNTREMALRLANEKARDLVERINLVIVKQAHNPT